MADDTPIINLSEYLYNVGIGLYGVNYEESCQYEEGSDTPYACEYEESKSSISLTQVESLFYA